MGERFVVNGLAVEIRDASTLAPSPRKRPAFTRPADGDLEAVALWEATAVPTATRTVAEHLAIWFGNLCGLCLQQVNMELRHPHPGCANVDHIEPTSRRGLNVWGNIRLVHRICNMQRSDLTLPEPSAQLYVALLAEATIKFVDPESFKPSALWAARDTAAFMVASRAMMLKGIATDVERGIDDGFTDRTRAEVSLLEARVEKALAKVRELQSSETLG